MAEYPRGRQVGGGNGIRSPPPGHTGRETVSGTPIDGGMEKKLGHISPVVEGMLLLIYTVPALFCV